MNKQELDTAMLKFCLNVRHVCATNCGVRINAAAAALVPALDIARTTWPTLHEYMPAHLYSVGFILLAVINVLLHIRFPGVATPLPPAGGAE